MNIRSIPKDQREVVENLLSLGWTFKKGSRGLKMYDPDGIFRVTIHSSPSDRRALKNLIGVIRQRSGFRV